MHINKVSGEAVDAAIRVHSVLGPGLLERAYQVCLAHEIGKRGLRVRAEVPMPVRYDGVELDLAYRIDLLVEECVVIEVKSVAKLLPIHEAQLLSHLTRLEEARRVPALGGRPPGREFKTRRRGDGNVPLWRDIEYVRHLCKQVFARERIVFA